MSISHTLFGERALTKVIGVYADRVAAVAAREQLKRVPGLDAERVLLLSPDEPPDPQHLAFSRRLEPEPRGIERTLIRTHLILGGLGAVAGLMVFMVMWLYGQSVAQESPALMLSVTLFFGTLFGLLGGGFLSLRLDHVRVIAIARSAMRRGRWVVVVHPRNPAQTRDALGILRDSSRRVVRSF